MMKRHAVWGNVFFALSLSFAACKGSEPDASSDAIVSATANILDFAFTGEMIIAKDEDPQIGIRKQLTYLQGVIARKFSSGAQIARLNVKVSSVTAVDANSSLVKYTTVLPVAWAKTNSIPSTYEFVVPRNVYQLANFEAAYDGKCGTRHYSPGSFWYDFDPKAATCVLKDSDVVRVNASVKTSTLKTSGKYPEYDKIWSDGALNAVAVFAHLGSSLNGQDMSLTESDDFIANISGALTNPVISRGTPSATIVRSQTLKGTHLVGGVQRPVTITVLNTPDLTETAADFDNVYNQLSANADILLYNGHAGLGRNIAAFGRKGTVRPGQYQLMLADGCQSFSMIDPLYFKRRTEANGAAADPNGTKFLDVVTNAVNGYANSIEEMSTPLIVAALNADTPRTYDEILTYMPAIHIPTVLGEEDNAYTRRR